MSLKELVRRLSDDLETWSSRGLNEAQTSQVVILPMLQALGYNIWNPFEVVAQGSSHGYFPDYAIELDGKIRFIIEVKALNKNFSENDQAQAVNYVNAQGRRWAILTDGRAWHFFDNQIAKPAAEKLALTVDLQNKRAATYLQKLLTRKFWESGEADNALATLVDEIHDDIRKRIKLGEIEEKLGLELKEGFTQDRKGLKKAIQLTLEPNEKELAYETFQELATKLLGNDGASANAIVSSIKQGISNTSPPQRSGKTSGLMAWIGDEKVDALSWRDITAGIAEAIIGRGDVHILKAMNLVYASNDEKRKSSGEAYPPHAYRNLSNGHLLFVHMSADNHRGQIKKMLEQMNAPAKMIKVSYKESTYELP